MYLRTGIVRGTSAEVIARGEDILDRHAAGQSYRTIAAALGISASRVGQLADRAAWRRMRFMHRCQYCDGRGYLMRSPD